MKKKLSGIILFALLMSLCLGSSVMAASGKKYGNETVTIGKIPVQCQVNADENNYFVKGALDESQISFSRAETDLESVESLLDERDNEMILFPAKYTVKNTPYYMYVFVTDGYTNSGSSLISIQERDSWLYFQSVLEEYYAESEQPEWQDYYITQNAVFAVCNRVIPDSDGKSDSRRATDFYTVWNGDLVQIMVAFKKGDESKAVKWAEQFLDTWE